MQRRNLLIRKVFVNSAIVLVIINVIDFVESVFIIDVLRLPYVYESNPLYPHVGWGGLLIVKVLYCALVAGTALYNYNSSDDKNNKDYLIMLTVGSAVFIALTVQILWIVVQNAAYGWLGALCYLK